MAATPKPRKAAKNPDTTVGADTLAQLFDLDSQSIQKLAKSGVVVRVARGKYLLEPSVRNYVRHLRERAAGRAGNNSRLSVVDESALLKRSQRALNEKKLAELDGELVPYDRIAPAWARVARAVRGAVLAIPGKARFQLPHLTAHDAEVMAEICRDQLECASMSDAPPAPDDD